MFGGEIDGAGMLTTDVRSDVGGTTVDSIDMSTVDAGMILFKIVCITDVIAGTDGVVTVVVAVSGIDVAEFSCGDMVVAVTLVTAESSFMSPGFTILEDIVVITELPSCAESASDRETSSNLLI